MWTFLMFCVLVNQEWVSGQSPNPEESPRNPVPPALANIWSDLGDMILDVDEKLYRLTSSKSQFGSDKTEEKQNIRRNYFDRIRENYKNLHDQIGQTLSAPSDILKLPELVNLNFQNRGQKSSIDLSLPFLPMTVKVNSKSSPNVPKEKVKDSDVPTQDIKYPDVVGSINIGRPKQATPEKDASNSKGDYESIDDGSNLQKRSSRPIKSVVKTPLRKDSIAKTESSNRWDSEHSFSNKRSQSNEFNHRAGGSEIQGRILGDLMFSESTFDKYFRQMLKYPGKWLLDSNIRPPKDIVEGIREVTRDQFKDIQPPRNKPNLKTSQNPTLGLKQKNRYVEEELNSNYQHQVPIFESNHAFDSRIILAFTPEGLPLKLKIDPSFESPLQFLHEKLNSARVSLNIPINSFNGIRAAGNDVLQLGFGLDDMQSRTPYFDLSDRRQLNYLLRSLKKQKYEFEVL